MNFFEGAGFGGGIPRNNGAMTPIDELSQETNESSQISTFNTINYNNNFGIVTDNASVYSNNSRNFQMPEKDLIMEISRQRDQMLTSEPHSDKNGEVSDNNQTTVSKGSFIEI